MGECRQHKHTQHAPSMKTECVWIKKKGHIRKNLTKNGEPQRYNWGMQKKIMMMVAIHLSCRGSTFNDVNRIIIMLVVNLLRRR